jgi:predicted membrane protein
MTSSASAATITNSTTISSILPAKAFILGGAWHLKAENGKITFFDVRFTKVHLDASNRHVHEIGNFRPASNNTSFMLNPDGITTIAGTVDIKLNGATTWTNVKTVIIIDKLSTIVITLDPKDTSNHFLGQSVYGTVSMLKDKDRHDIVTFVRP